MSLAQRPETIVTMQSNESRIEFCDRYFASVGAVTTYEAPSYREYCLPIDVDKELTDRPFYWMWVEKTGQEVQPTTLRLAFDEQAQERENKRVREEALQAASPYLTEIQRQYFVAPKVELVTLGSFRLDKLYDSCLKRGRFASIAPRTRVPDSRLVPWLMLNCLVSYRCDITEQSMVSIGLCLENGQCVEDFHRMIENIEMEPLNPKRVESRVRIPYAEGFQRVRQYLSKQVAAGDHQWATEADERLEKEIGQIKTYYDSLVHEQSETEQRVSEAERERKIAQIIARGAPKIEIEIKQAALVGLIDKGGLM